MTDQAEERRPSSDAATETEPRTSRPNRELLRAVLSALASPSADIRRTLEAGEEALIAFDPGRTILCANARGERLFGYAPGELDGRSTDVLIPARLRQPDAPPQPEAADLMQVELPGLMRDGTERPIEWCFGSVRRKGQLVFVMTVRDREALDLAIERLRASEHRFQLFVNSVQDCAIYMLDAAGRVSSWNAGAARIKGWEGEEVVGQPFDVFFTEEDREAGLPAKLLAAALQEGSHRTAGWRVRKDGTRFYVEGSLTVLRDPQGQVQGFTKITRDLTERLRAEENERRLIVERAAREAAEQAERRVRASEDRLARLQRITAGLSKAASPEDVAGAVLRECGEAMEAATAIYLLAADGENLELLAQKGHPDDAAERFRSIPLSARTPLTDAGRERTAAFFESFDACAEQYPALRDAIGAGDLQASAALPLIAHGDLLGVLGVRFTERRPFDAGERRLLLTISDVCAQAIDRARLFAAETEARATAEAASRAKDEFLAMLGHELRNPLAPISTAVQLIKLKGQDRIQRERDVIERQVAHLNTLVDDLLDVSRVARGLISLSRAPTEVSEILSKAVEMASPLIEQRSHQLAVTAPTSGLFLDADPLRMAQVVSNLLTNAAKYTPPGGHVWLSAGLEHGEVVIRVRDDGEGIAPDLLPHVFDLFVQGPRSIARSEGGLGLGLALVKNLVGLHGGTVAATSEGVGRGSEFVVRVPVSQSAARVAHDKTPPLQLVAQAGKRILLVDDNEDARELLGEMLREMGHDVELAPDGPTALDKLETFPADVAILDLGLPVMDGFELARRIAGTRAGARTRLVALTGYGRERDIAQTREVGFDVHLVKPVNFTLLASAIDHEGVRRKPSSRSAG